MVNLSYIDAGTIAQIDTVRPGAGGIKTPKNQKAVGSPSLGAALTPVQVLRAMVGTPRRRSRSPLVCRAFNMSFNGDLFKFHFIAEKNAGYG